MEQDNFLYMLSTADFTLPDGAVQYYVAGEYDSVNISIYIYVISIY